MRCSNIADAVYNINILINELYVGLLKSGIDFMWFMTNKHLFMNTCTFIFHRSPAFVFAFTFIKIY